MKKKLLLLSAFAFCSIAEAQQYTPLQVNSGYSADVVANGVGAALLSTTDAVDNANFCFMSTDFASIAGNITPDYALPASGTLTSLATAGLTFQLAPYGGDNSLRLQEQSDSGTLTFSNAVSATSVYLLATSGSGAATLGGTIHFSDNSTQDIGTANIPDWFFSNALPIAIQGFGRVGRLDDIMENPLNDPRLYQYEIQISAANQTKTITSIDLSKTSAAEGVINIMGVSAKLLGTCPAPTAIVLSALTETMVTVTWTAPVIVPAIGYDYYISTSEATPLPSTLPTGTVNSGLTTTTISGLTIGTHYCVWVRSHCSATEIGEWGGPACFTTGQISNVSDAEVPTTFVDIDTIDTTTPTNCPGTLSVTVPDGYQIASVGTAYDMQTASNGWMVEQRSLLVCTTNGNMEAAVTSGVGSTGGTYSYERNGIDIANGLTGTVNFELRAWRTYGAGECDVVYNRVVDHTWSVTITYQVLGTKGFNKNAFSVYPNPTSDIVNVSGNIVMKEAHLYNLLGQEVMANTAVTDKQLQLHTAALPTGKYILKVFSDDGVQTLSVLKN